MSYETEWLSEAATAGEVCQHLELILMELRASGDMERLPRKFQSISAKTPDEVLQWCKILDHSFCGHAPLDYYFTLFDTARARITALKAEEGLPKNSIPYVVYIRTAEEPNGTPGARRFATIDEAASACISLREYGYQILRVRLPSGNYVTGAQIEWAMKMGVSSVKIALTR